MNTKLNKEPDFKIGDKVYCLEEGPNFNKQFLFISDSQHSKNYRVLDQEKNIIIFFRKEDISKEKLVNKHYFKTINEYCIEAYEIAKSKGWHDEEREMGTILALIHGEVSEAMEADRKGDYENFKEELADIVIRVFDLCGHEEIDLEEAINKKMEYNKTRTYKHGNKKY